jgi:polyhydroxybutyrate depolymerase
MVVDNRLRDYRLFVPPGLDTSKPAPLVIVLHGTPIDAAGLEDTIHFQPEAAAAGFLAVYPDGCDENWDSMLGSSDVHFVARLIDELAGTHPIDRSRIYAVGVSAGAEMAYRLACDLADRLAGVVSIAGQSPIGDCKPARPLPILEMHGTMDYNVPYDSGVAAIHDWLGFDGCTGNPAVTKTGITQTSTWSHCNGGAIVRLDTVEGGHHTWFGSKFDPVPGEPDANTTVWAFLKQFRLPA